MIEVVSHNPPFLSLRIVHQGTELNIQVFGVLEIYAILLVSLESLINRYGLAEGLRDWVYLRSVSLVSMSQAEKLVTVTKKDLRILAEKSAQCMTKRYKNGKKWGYFNITETTVDISESAYLALKKARSLRT